MARYRRRGRISRRRTRKSNNRKKYSSYTVSRGGIRL